jgi:regulator of protease activity HflC (stomatin/prohibitin superfamily)
MFWFWLVLAIVAVLVGKMFRKAMMNNPSWFVDDDTPKQLGGEKSKTIVIKIDGIANVIYAVLFTFAGISFLFSSIRSVPAGHVGVGDFYGWVYGPKSPGLNFIVPLSKLVMIPTRTVQDQETMPCPTKEGLTVSLDVSILYHVDGSQSVKLYKELGPKFNETIIVPQSRSAARGATVRYEAKALYTSGREEISNEIFNELSDSLMRRGIILERVLLRSVALPTLLTEAINNKMAAEQQAEQMKFVLDKERMEAERKRVEATGIRDFQITVQQGISQQLLEWKGIEATERLAHSPNAKIVVIGNPKNGLPLILGGQN